MYIDIDKSIVEEYNISYMIIECPECGEKNQAIQPPQPDKNYRCGKCGAAITILQTADTPTETTNPPVISDTGDISGEKTVVKKINRSKDYTISGILIVLSMVIGFVDYIYINQNPYPSVPTPFYRQWIIYSPEVAIAAIIAVFFIIPKGHKHVYLYYFAILFLILSVFSALSALLTYLM